MTLHNPYHRWAWEALGIAPTGDRQAIRKAYARRLKAIDPERDPQAFIDLREAWAVAQQLAAASHGQAPAPGARPPAEDAEESDEDRASAPDAAAPGGAWIDLASLSLPVARSGAAPTPPAGPDRPDTADPPAKAEPAPPPAPVVISPSPGGDDIETSPTETGPPEMIVTAADEGDEAPPAGPDRPDTADPPAKAERAPPPAPVVISPSPGGDDIETSPTETGPPEMIVTAADEGDECPPDDPERPVPVHVAAEPEISQAETAPDDSLQAADPFPDAALFDRIERLMTVAASKESAAELEEAVWALLAHPALERITESDAVEDWLADRITRNAPRSDPALELAADHFGWAEKAADWSAPPRLRWLATRLADVTFEQRLLGELPRFRPVLAMLRSDAVPPPQDEVRRIAPDLRDFIDFAPQYLPTSLETSDPRMRDWWNDYFRRQPAWQREYDALRRLWRSRRSLQSLLEPVPRQIGPLLTIGILCLPFLFCWALLRRGYAPAARWAAFGWAAFALFLFANEETFAPPPATTAPPPIIAVPPGPYSDIMADLDPLLDPLLRTENGYIHLQIVHRALADRLATRWREARAAGESRAAFIEAIGRLLDEAYLAGLRGGSPALQEEYWRLKLEQLAWLRDAPGGGTAACATYLRTGEASVEFPPRTQRRQAELIARALREPPDAARTGQREGQFRISDGLHAAAAERAGLARWRLNAALNDRGTAAERCAGRIGLIEAGLALAPPEREALLREMSAGL